MILFEPCTFEATLWRVEAPGGWTFAPVPAERAPPVVAGWGRTPVRATVDGRSWDTSVWADKRHGALLPVPKNIRQGKEAGDVVVVSLAPRAAP